MIKQDRREGNVVPPIRLLLCFGEIGHEHPPSCELDSATLIPLPSNKNPHEVSRGIYACYSVW